MVLDWEKNNLQNTNTNNSVQMYIGTCLKFEESIHKSE